LNNNKIKYNKAFSLDGKKFAGVGPFKSKIKCWEVRTGKVIKKLAAGFSTRIFFFFLKLK